MVWLVTPTGTKGCARPRGGGSPFGPDWCYQPGPKVPISLGCQTQDKRTPLLSRPSGTCCETGTTRVFQLGQIDCSIVVIQAGNQGQYEGNGGRGGDKMQGKTYHPPAAVLMPFAGHGHCPQFLTEGKIILTKMKGRLQVADS